MRMSRRQYNQAQPATSAAANLRAARRGLVCLLLAGRAFGATHDADIASRPAAELADLSLEQLMEIQVPTVVGASKHAQKVAPLYRDKAFAGLQAQYTSSHTTPAGGSLSGYWLLNATLFAHKFWGGWEASASLYNILNQRYSDPTDSIPATVQQDGRQFRVKLTYRL